MGMTRSDFWKLMACASHSFPVVGCQECFNRLIAELTHKVLPLRFLLGQPPEKKDG